MDHVTLLKTVLKPKLRSLLVEDMPDMSYPESYLWILDTMFQEKMEEWEQNKPDFLALPSESKEQIFVEALTGSIKEIWDTYKDRIPVETLGEKLSLFVDKFPYGQFL